MNYIKKFLFAIILIFISMTAFSMEVAITVDDLPANGNLPPHMTRMEVMQKMLATFKKHHINGVYGFVNGSKINETSDGLAVLEAWINAGNYLGNHTFNHLDLVKTDSTAYITDIKNNEPILHKLMQDNDYRYFRYPYLAEGNTQQKRDAVRHFLSESGYKISPVTVDFFEYEWNDPYVRCIDKHDQNSIKWIRENYLEQANNALIISHELSQMLLNRDLKNILVIHINAFTSEMLDDLLTSYEKQHVKFIALQDALNDNAYQINPNIVRDRAYTFLNQVRLSRGMQNPMIVQKLYDSLPEEKLNQLCR